MISEEIDLDKKGILIEEVIPKTSEVTAESTPVIESAVNAIQETDQPNPRKHLTEEIVVTEPPANAERVQNTANRTFPDPGYEGLMAAIRKEEICSAQIASQEKKANECMAIIDKLLDLTAELSALPDQDKVDFTDKIRTILSDLKNQGIDLWKDENSKEIAREKVAELRSLISTHTDKARTQQQLILTKMQGIANDLMAILESAKGIHREDSRAKSSFVRNQRVSS